MTNVAPRRSLTILEHQQRRPRRYVDTTRAERVGGIRLVK
jgi:hypothetical protein